MATLPKISDSTPRLRSYGRRMERLCRQVPGATQFGTRIKIKREALMAAESETESKVNVREDAYDDLINADRHLDAAIVRIDNRLKEFDKENPGARVRLTVIPEGKTLPYTRSNLIVEPDKALLIVHRFQLLGETHPLYDQAAYLMERITLVKTTITAYQQAILEEKRIKESEKAVKLDFCREYEAIALDARKEFGKNGAEIILPQIGKTRKSAGPIPPPA